ncbi:hypothetical protein GCM10008949_47200 [Deinococcus humi]|nr:hypothetical protein GCM10008949_47200 [Deinococcus humi]
MFISPGKIKIVQMDVQRLADPQPRFKDQPEQQGVPCLPRRTDGKDALNVVPAQTARVGQWNFGTFNMLGGIKVWPAMLPIPATEALKSGLLAVLGRGSPSVGCEVRFQSCRIQLFAVVLQPALEVGQGCPVGPDGGRAAIQPRKEMRGGDLNITGIHTCDKSLILVAKLVRCKLEHVAP